MLWQAFFLYPFVMELFSMWWGRQSCWVLLFLLTILFSIIYYRGDNLMCRWPLIKWIILRLLITYLCLFIIVIFVFKYFFYFELLVSCCWCVRCLELGTCVWALASWFLDLHCINSERKTMMMLVFGLGFVLYLLHLIFRNSDSTVTFIFFIIRNNLLNWCLMWCRSLPRQAKLMLTIIFNLIKYCRMAGGRSWLFSI